MKAMLVKMLKMSTKLLVLKFWWRKVVKVAEDIDEDMLLVLMLEILGKPLYLLAPKVSQCSHRI